jgi:hypothetical protein
MKKSNYSKVPVPKMNFRQWLLEQKYRDDEVGDLARETLRDIRRKHLPETVQSSGDLVAHVRTAHERTADGFMDAIRSARREYAVDSRRVVNIADEPRRQKSLFEVDDKNYFGPSENASRGKK